MSLNGVIVSMRGTLLTSSSSAGALQCLQCRRDVTISLVYHDVPSDTFGIQHLCRIGILRSSHLDRF